MKSLETHFTALRRHLSQATDLVEPWSYFHEHMSCRLDLHMRSRPRSNPMLEKVLAVCGTQALGRSQVDDEARIQALYLKKERFWHGLCLFGGLTGIFFHFEKSDTGLLGLKESLFAPQTHLVRFTLLPQESRSGFPVLVGPRAQA